MGILLGRHLLAAAPFRLVLLTAFAAATLVGTGALPPAGHAVTFLRGSLPLPVPTGVLLGALSRVVMFAAVTAVMAWRARTVEAERAVWRWMARAAGLAALVSLLSGGLDVAAAAGLPLPAGLGAVVLGVGVVAVCPLLYQGLIHWNRYGTVTSQPGDWLNGVSAVFTLTALGNLVVPWLHSPLLQWPVWQLQLWLVRVSAEVMLVGTAATVLVIGALAHDARAWALTLALLWTAALDATSVANVAAAAGNGPLSDAGWAVVAVVLAASAVLRAAPLLPRPVTTAAPTAGSFVVLLASIAVLVSAGVVGGGAGSIIRWAAVWAGAAAFGVSVRGVQLIRLLAHLVLSRHEALTDELTGLFNRRALDRRLSEDLSTGRPLTLMIIDLDGFKEINDRFGHAVGDELLRRAGKVLSTLGGPAAFAARLGGDEFAIILPATPAGTSSSAGSSAGSSARGSATDAALDVFAALSSATANPVLIDGRLIRVSGSVGIATSSPGESGEEVLRNADAAMYRAKLTGGCAVAVHDDAAAAAAAEHTRLIEELKVLLHSPDADTDLDGGQVAVHYQAQVSTSGAVVGVEALVRWDHPRLGLLYPDRFLALVEEYSLMSVLTTQVMWQAVRQAAQWRDAGHQLRISVNLSATCLTHPDLPALVDAVLAETALDPSTLVLEVTETSVMHEPERSIQRLRELAGRGIDISIDDYGSGYSSLAYLNDLPATELKLDRSLTQHVTSNPRTADIVAGTVALAHRLGLRVVAEGVEDEAMLSALHDLGCDETQGYLHGRPMGADAFIRWLSKVQAMELDSLQAPSP